MKGLYLAFCLLLLSSALFAQKEQPLPKDMPPYGPEKPMPAPDVKIEKLDNGLTLWLVARPGLPKISSLVVVSGGLASDPKELPGISELLGRTVTTGTKSRTSKQIAEEMQGAGADLSAGSSRDITQVSASMLSAKMNQGLSVLADVVLNASFPDSEVDLAKRNLSSAIDAREAQPGFQANRALAKVLFKDGPYSVVGATKDSLAAMTAADLKKEYARRFRPDQAILIVVGDFSADKMLALVREKFGPWRAPAGPPVAPASVPSVEVEHAAFLVPRPQSVQTTLALAGLGPRRSDPDFEAAEVADGIYGGTFGSRLTLNIREDKGYTYSPGSFLQTLRSAGLVRTQADVRNAVTGASLNEIFYELNRMATTSPTDRELEQVKRNLVGIQAIQLQSRGGLVGELATLWVYGLPPGEIGEHGKKVAKVTAADVDAVARKYFGASRMAVIAVGEEKAVREQLTPLGLPIHPAP
ncbi:MAG TPA: pitrilysin family protein [Candidatus Angelobacter sp.]|nr:pitrilysin family protein [Candidatus Angelobacter sp.]